MLIYNFFINSKLPATMKSLLESSGWLTVWINKILVKEKLSGTSRQISNNQVHGRNFFDRKINQTTIWHEYGQRELELET